MKSNEIAYPKLAIWAGSVALVVMAGAVGLWLWQTYGGSMALVLAVGLLALSAALGGVWLYRIRAARRLSAVLDAYAEKELARAERRPHMPFVTSNRAFSESNV